MSVPARTVTGMPKQRARRDEPPPGPDSRILRGYPLSRDVLRANARDNHDVYGFYGVSVFRADSTDDVDAVCATKLRALARVALFRVADLTASGLELWATGSAPHYDVVRGPEGTTLDDLIDRILSTAWTEYLNPHYREGEGR